MLTNIMTELKLSNYKEVVSIDEKCLMAQN